MKTGNVGMGFLKNLTNWLERQGLQEVIELSSHNLITQNRALAK